MQHKHIKHKQNSPNQHPKGNATMAEFKQDPPNVGSLSTTKIDDTGTFEFLLTPNPETLSKEQIELAKRPILLARANLTEGYIEIFPLNTRPGSTTYLKQKYSQIKKLIIKAPSTLSFIEYDEEGPRWESIWKQEPTDILSCLPKGFTKDYRYGLGVTKDAYHFIIKEIENNSDITTIIFDDIDEMKIENNTLHIDLNEYQSTIDMLELIGKRGSDATRRVKRSYGHNTLATALDLKKTSYSLGRHPQLSLIARAADPYSTTSTHEYELLFDTLTSEHRKLAQCAPNRLPQLRKNIELVSLEQLISNFETYLRGKHSEKHWQKFFKKNLFALQQVFGMPTTLFRDEVTVGGRDFTGSGDKIVDFMFKNTLTNNIALVEIKRPGMHLLNQKEYRKGVYGPHKELNEAITQALDQCYHLQSELPTLKTNARQYDLESYNIRCIVIAGRTPSNDDDKKKSLELFRNNLRSVTIVTYDEILESLKALYRFLSNEDDPEK